MRVTLALASLLLIGCSAYGAESDSAPGAGKDGSGVVSTLVADPQGSGYMLAFPMDEAGMVAAESAPVVQVAQASKEKEEEATTTPSSTVSSTSTLQPKTTSKPFQQPSEADRRRKIEEMRKILGLPANAGQKPKPVPIEKPKPLLFPSLLKVLPRLENSPFSSLPLSLIRRSDEEGPKMLHGLLRQAATVFMRRALLDDEPETQNVNENKGKKEKDSMMFLLDDDKEDSKEDEKKGGKDDDDDDDDDIAFIPIPRPMMPFPGPFRRGPPPPPFGLPQRMHPQMGPRRPMPPRSFPPMGPPPQGPPRQPFFPHPQAPVQPVMLMLHPFMVPQQQPMMVPQQSMMHPLAFAHPPVPHPMMLPPPPPQFQPHPFMAHHPMMMPQQAPFLFAPQPQHPPMFHVPQSHQPMFVPQHQPQTSAPQPVLIRPVLVPEYRPYPVPVQEESEESPYMMVYEDAQPRFHHQHQQPQHPQPRPHFQPQSQVSARAMPAILSHLRRMQMLRELIMARSLQMAPRDIPRVAFHPPVPPRVPQGEREAAQSIFRPIFIPMGL